MIEGSSAVTTGTQRNDMPRAVRVLPRLGFESCRRRRVVIHSFREGRAFSNLIDQAAERCWFLVGAANLLRRRC